MESYNKLVRDNIPDDLDARGVPYEEKRIANEEEYRIELIKKLGEEVIEFSAEGSSEELADVIEVVHALLALPEFKDTEVIRLEKKAKKGGFENRIILKGTK